MPQLQELTKKEFKDLLDEYFAKPAKRQKLTQKEAQDLANLLNQKINIPIMGETSEGKILLKIVIKIDTFLYDNLPNEFYDLMRSLNKGIDDDEAKRLIKRLSKLANKKIDIPYIPEVAEYIAIKFILGILINAARENWDMGKAQEQASNLIISEIENEKEDNSALKMLMI